MTEWYCALRGQTEGPLTPERVMELRHRGDLSDSSLVWREGMERWLPLGEVLLELEGAPAVSPSPPAEPAPAPPQASVPEYRVVELQPLSPYALEELLNRWATEGWTLDQVVEGRLVVLRRQGDGS